MFGGHLKFEHDYCQIKEEIGENPDYGYSSSEGSSWMDVQNEMKYSVGTFIPTETMKWEGDLEDDKKRIQSNDGGVRVKKETAAGGTSLVIFNQVEGSFRCGQCDRKFVHEKSYKSHMKSHQGAFRCEVCFRSFSNVANLNVHRRIHTGSTPYKCEICSRPFRTSGMYKRHLYKEHPEHPLAIRMRESLVDYVCPNCGRILKTLGSYHRHVARHDVQNLHVCQLCHVDCFTHEAYLAHQKRCHSGEKGKHIEQKLARNTCHICNTSFYSMMALWNHASLYHVPFAGLPCNICGKLATTRNAFMTHRRSHLGSKDLVCHVCKRRFNKASHLQDHIRVHLEDYTYKCPVCSKGFLRPKNLKTHLLAKHRPTVDTCCIRTLQRRRKKELMGDDESNKSSSSTLHKRRILRIGENGGIQFLQKSGLLPDDETLDNILATKKTNTQETTAETEEDELSESEVYENFHENSTQDSQQFRVVTRGRTTTTTTATTDNDSDSDYEPEEDDDDDEDYEEEEEEEEEQVRSYNFNHNQISKNNPYVDTQGNPLFSKFKPTPITEKLVALAKQARKRRQPTN